MARLFDAPYVAKVAGSFGPGPIGGRPGGLTSCVDGTSMAGYASGLSKTPSVEGAETRVAMCTGEAWVQIRPLSDASVAEDVQPEAG